MSSSETIELRDQKARLANLDLAEEVNVYCDNLKIDVRLAIQSEVDNLNKLERELLGKIEEYRRDQLQAQQSEWFRRQLAEAMAKIEEMSAIGDELLAARVKSDEIAKRMNDLTFEMSLLESKMKREAFSNHFLKLNENPTATDHQVVELVEHLTVKEPDFTPFLVSDSAEPRQDDAVKSFYSPLFISDHTIAFIDRNTVCIWDLDRQTLVGKLEHFHYVECMALLPNGCLASFTDIYSLWIWDISARKVLRWYGKDRDLKGASSLLEPSPRTILFLQALPTGYLASFSRDSTIKIWDPSSSKENQPVVEISNFSSDYRVDRPSLSEMKALAGSNRVLGGTPSGNPVGMGLQSNGHLVTCYERSIPSRNAPASRVKALRLKEIQSVIQVWNPRNGKLVTSFTTDPKAAIKMLVLSNDNLLVEFTDFSVGIYDLTKAALVVRLNEPSQRRHFGFAQHPSGYVITFPKPNPQADGSHSVYVLNPEDGQLVQAYRFTPENMDRSQALCISPDGRRLICGHTWARTSAIPKSSISMLYLS